MNDQSFPVSPAAARSSSAGLILLIATVLEIFTMAHHPTVHIPDVVQALQQISKLSSLSAWVHGVLMALMLVIAFAFSEFAMRRGIARPIIRAGAIAYGAGILVMLGAAMVSGFIVADLASSLPHANAVDLQISTQLLILCRVLNQSCASFGAVAMSAGIALWSIDLLRDAGARRAICLLGLALSLLPAIALILGLIHLDVHGMMLVLLLQSVWNVAVAIALMRSTI
jgi:hypothetical protein